MYPRIKIDLTKLAHNLETVATTVKGIAQPGDGSNQAGDGSNQTGDGSIEPSPQNDPQNEPSQHDLRTLAIVTKVFCADPEIVKLVAESPLVDYMADARLENLATYVDIAHENGKSTILLRIPMPSELEEVIRTADICQISEIETAKLLNAAAERANKTQKILLMIDLGDLREGIFYENKEEIEAFVTETQKLKNIELIGLSVNLSCYGAILPTKDNLGNLVAIAEDIRKAHGINLEIISGGATSSLYLMENGDIPPGINNLRIGEAFAVGYDSSGNQRVPGTYDDAFILEAELVELKSKPSIPIGVSGRDAFGNVPEFRDKGTMTRGIVAIGKQDIPLDKLTPLDGKIEILGGSSDHMILDMTVCSEDYKVGDIVEFRMEYGAVLMATTSKYVDRTYV